MRTPHQTFNWIKQVKERLCVLPEISFQFSTDFPPTPPAPLPSGHFIPWWMESQLSSSQQEQRNCFAGVAHSTSGYGEKTFMENRKSKEQAGRANVLVREWLWQTTEARGAAIHLVTLSSPGSASRVMTANRWAATAALLINQPSLMTPEGVLTSSLHLPAAPGPERKSVEISLTLSFTRLSLTRTMRRHPVRHRGHFSAWF